MPKTVARKKAVVRRDWTRAEVKELKKHSKTKRAYKPSLGHSSVLRVRYDRRLLLSEFRWAIGAVKRNEFGRSRCRTVPGTVGLLSLATITPRLQFAYPRGGQQGTLKLTFRAIKAPC